VVCNSIYFTFLHGALDAVYDDLCAVWEAGTLLSLVRINTFAREK
jgi:hypothetical protein